MISAFSMMMQLQVMLLVMLLVGGSAMGFIVDVVEVAVGESHTCVVEGDGKAKCFGANLAGELGLGLSVGAIGTKYSSMGWHLPFLNLGTGFEVAQISAGNLFSCAVLTNSTLKCWGYNSVGQLGLGLTELHIGMTSTTVGNYLPVVDLGINVAVSNVSCGGYHACARLTTGEAKCWGENGVGQLGLGSSVALIGTSPTQMGDALPVLSLGAPVKKIIAGGLHTCALLGSASPFLKCWGYNVNGQLGIGSSALVVGTQPSDMANLASPALGTDVQVLDFDLGQSHTCAVVTGNLVKCWGDNTYGQLGLTGTTTVGTSLSQLGSFLPFVDLGTDVQVVKVSLGDYFSCVLTKTAEIKCWGQNNAGQLGIGSAEYQIPTATQVGVQIPADMGNALPFVDVGSYTVLDISTGGETTCAICNNLKVKCWGNNKTGQLGICSSLNIGTNYTQMSNNLQFADDCGPLSLAPTTHKPTSTKSGKKGKGKKG